MLRNLATSLVATEKVQTTLAKAKEVRRVVEKLITLAKVDTLANRRRAYSYLLSKAAVQKLFSDLGPRYKSRPGGYLRVLRTAIRHGDAASLAVIALVGDESKKPKKRARPQRARAEKTAAPALEPAPNVVEGEASGK